MSGTTLTIKQAARVADLDEKTIRRWITGTSPRLPKVTDRRGRYMIEPSELERVLAEDATRPAPLLIDASRLTALEQGLDAIERRLAELEQRLEEAIGRETARTPRRAARPMQPAATAAPDESQGWQADWVDLPSLLKAHPQAKPTTVMRHMQPYLKKGHWRVNGHAVMNALDSEGQAEFRRLFGDAGR